MKKIALLVLGPAAGVVVVLLAFLAFDDRPVVPIVAKCGFSVGKSLVKSGGGSLSTNKWTVYTYGGAFEAPFVAVERLAEEERGTLSNLDGCALTIVSLPPADARELDWRIGRIAKNIKPFLGKTLRYKLHLKADEQALLKSATLYVYDGKTVTSRGIPKIFVNWREFDVVVKIPSDATAVEFWFRLLFDSPDVTPRENKLYLVASVEEVSGKNLQVSKKLDKSPPLVKSTWTAAFCPLLASPAFKKAAGAAYSPDKWRVYRHDTATAAPTVEITSISGAGPKGEKICRLSISNGPEQPGAAIDWRMGQSVGVEGLRGKKVQFTVKFRSDKNMALNTSYIYTYFGGTSDTDVVTKLGKEWIEKSVTVDVPEDATVAEFWYRLVLDNGTIIHGNGTIDILPELNILN